MINRKKKYKTVQSKFYSAEITNNLFRFLLAVMFYCMKEY